MQVYGAGDGFHADAESARVLGVVGWAVAAGSVILGWMVDWAWKRGFFREVSVVEFFSAFSTCIARCWNGKWTGEEFHKEDFTSDNIVQQSSLSIECVCNRYMNPACMRRPMDPSLVASRAILIVPEILPDISTPSHTRSAQRAKQAYPCIPMHTQRQNTDAARKTRTPQCPNNNRATSNPAVSFACRPGPRNQS